MNLPEFGQSPGKVYSGVRGKSYFFGTALGNQINFAFQRSALVCQRMLSTAKRSVWKFKRSVWKLLRTIFACIISFQLALYPTLLRAQEIHSATGGPSVIASPNGVPLVNIVAPNASGLSHNRYQRFDVGTRGAILNNSNLNTSGGQEASKSLLGGQVGVNPNLGGSTAKTILNEITSTRRSDLRGYLEVHGRAANVIVANPNGITCDGCGFINSPRVTVTTGRPKIGTDGVLKEFQVEGGDVSFGRGGANVTNVDLFDVVSRTINIDGPVFANNVRMRAGRNVFNYATGAVKPLPGSSSKPTVAIDSTAFGGISAKNIDIIATEKGVGVTMRGNMAAHTGQMTLSANGKLTLGTVTARERVRVRSTGHARIKRITSPRPITVEARLGVEIETIASQDAAAIYSGDGDIFVADAGISGSLDIATGRDITLGLLSSETEAPLVGTGSIFLGDIVSGGTLNVNSTSGNLVGNNLISYHDMTLDAGNELAISSVALAAGDITTSGGSVNAATLLAGLDIDASLAQSQLIPVFSGVSAELNITARSGSAYVENSGAPSLVTLTAEQDAFVGETASKTIKLSALSGNLAVQEAYAGDTLVLSAGRDVEALFLLSQGTAMLTADGNAAVDQLSVDGNVLLTTLGGALDVGSISAGGSVSVNTVGDATIASLVNESPVTFETVSGALTVERLTSLGTVEATADGGIIAGTWEVGDDVTLDGGSGSVSFSKALFAEGKVNVTADDVVDIQQVAALGDINLTSTSADVVVDYVASNANLLLTAGRDVDAQQLLSQGTATVTAGGNAAVDQLSADGNVLLTTLDGALDVGSISAGGSVSVNTVGDATIASLVNESPVTFETVSGALTVERLTSLGTVEATADGGIIAGTWEVGDDVTLDGGSGSVNFSKALFAEGKVNVTADDVIDIQQVAAPGDINLTSTSADVVVDYVASNANLLLTAGRDVDAQQLLSQGTATVTAGGNAAVDQLSADGNVLLTTLDGVLDVGSISAGGSVSVNTVGDATIASILSEGSVTFKTVSGLLNVENLVSLGTVDATSDGEILAETWVVGDDVTLNGGQGNVSFSQALTAVGNVNVTTDGDVDIQQVAALEDINLTSISADVVVGYVAGNANLLLTAGRDILAGQDAIALQDAGLFAAIEVQGSAVLSADRDVKTALIAAENNVNVTASRDIIVGQAASEDDLSFVARNNFTAQGTVASLGNLSLQAVTGALDLDGQVLSQGDVTLLAGNRIDAAQLVGTTGNLSVDSGSGAFVFSNVRSGQNATITGTGVSGSGDLSAAQDVTVASLAGINIGGTVAANRDLALSSAQAIEYGRVSAIGDVSLTSQTGDISLDKLTAAGGVLALDFTGANIDLAAVDSTIFAGEMLTVQATTADLSGGQFILGGLSVSATDSVDLTSANIYTSKAVGGSGDIAIEAATLFHDEITQLQAEGNLTLATTGTLDSSMTLAAAGDLRLETTGALTNRNLIYSGGSTTLLASAFTNIDATVRADGDLTIARGQDGSGSLSAMDAIFNQNAILQAGNHLTISAASLRNETTGIQVVDIPALTVSENFAITDVDAARAASAILGNINIEGGLFVGASNFDFFSAELSGYQFTSAMPLELFKTESGRPAGLFIGTLLDGWGWRPWAYTSSIFPTDTTEISSCPGDTCYILKRNTSYKTTGKWVDVNESTSVKGTDYYFGPDPLSYYQFSETLNSGSGVTGVISGQTLASDNNAEAIISAGSASISAGNISNVYATISTTADMDLTGGTLENNSVSLTETTEFTCNSSATCYGRVDSGAAFSIDAGQTATTNRIISDGGKILAGGSLTGSFTGEINNTSIAQNTLAGIVTATSGLNFDKVVHVDTVSVGSPSIPASGILDVTSTIDALTGSGGLFQSVGSDSIGAGTSSGSPVFAPVVQLDKINISLGLNTGTTLQNAVENTVRQSLDAGQAFSGLNLNRPEINSDVVVQLAPTAPQIRVDAFSSSSPGHEYLIETRLKFIDQNSFYGSQYYMDQIGHDPDHQILFLGDPYFETELVQQSILRATGQTLLDPLDDDARSQMKRLIDNGVALQKELDLTPGTALSPQQTAALTNDVVVYEQREVEGRQVYVPQVYLAKLDERNFASGSTISGTNVALTGSSITNQGTLRGSESITLKATTGDVVNIALLESAGSFAGAGPILSGGALITGQDISISASDFTNIGNVIATGSARIEAGNITSTRGDIIAERGILTLSSLNNINLETTSLDANTINILAGQDFVAEGVEIRSSGDTDIFAAGNAIITSLQTTSDTVRNRNKISTVTNLTSSLYTGGDLSVAALGDVTLAGVDGTVGGNASFQALSNLTFDTVADEYTSSSGDYRNGHDLFSLDSTITSLAVGGNLSATAVTGSLTMVGSQIDAGGGVALSGAQVFLAAAQDIDTYQSRHYKKSFFSKKKITTSTTSIVNQGVLLDAGGDITVTATGSDLMTAGTDFFSANGDISLQASRNVLAGTYTDTFISQYSKEKSSFFGLINSSSQTYSNNQYATGTNALAALDLSVVSGNDMALVGATLSAGQNLTIQSGGDLDITAAISSEVYQHFSHDVGLVLMTTIQENSYQEFAALSEFNAGGNMAFSVDDTTRLTLYNRPGEEVLDPATLYPDELLALEGLDLLSRELANEYFYDEQTSLSPAFKALLAVSLAYTGVGAAVAGALGATGVVSSGVSAFVNSAILTTIDQAVGGDFDIGEILEGAAFSGVSAGLTSAINLDTFIGDIADGSPLTQNIFGSAFGSSSGLTVQNLFDGAIDGIITSGLSSAVYGTDFGESLSSSLINMVANLALTDVQFEIGELGKGIPDWEGSPAHMLLHGIAGCAAAAAQGGNCAAGAAGGIAQSLYAGSLEGTELDDSQQRQYAAVIGGLAGLLFSGGEAQNVDIASSVSVSGISYNRQLHREEVVWLRENAKAFAEEQCALGNCISTQEALKQLTLQAGKQIDFILASGTEENAAARKFIEQNSPKNRVLVSSSGQYVGSQQQWFDATLEQFSNQLINLPVIRESADVYKYFPSVQGARGGNLDVFVTNLVASQAQDDGYDLSPSSRMEASLEVLDAARAVLTNYPGEAAVGLITANLAVTSVRTLLQYMSAAEIATLTPQQRVQRTNMLINSYLVTYTTIPGGQGGGQGGYNQSTRLAKVKAAFNRLTRGGVAPNRGAWTVDPSFRSADEAAGVLVNGSYIKNPTARNLSDSVTASGKVRVDGQLTNGQYMYVVDPSGNIVIGTRGGQRMPHPTLIGGSNPQVQAAGIVDIRGGKIYSVDNASGHFKPGNGSLQNAESAFGGLPSNSFHTDFKGYVPFDG